MYIFTYIYIHKVSAADRHLILRQGSSVSKAIVNIKLLSTSPADAAAPHSPGRCGTDVNYVKRKYVKGRADGKRRQSTLRIDKKQFPGNWSWRCRQSLNDECNQLQDFPHDHLVGGSMHGDWGTAFAATHHHVLGYVEIGYGCCQI